MRSLFLKFASTFIFLAAAFSFLFTTPNLAKPANAACLNNVCAFTIAGPIINGGNVVFSIKNNTTGLGADAGDILCICNLVPPDKLREWPITTAGATSVSAVGLPNGTYDAVLIALGTDISNHISFTLPAGGGAGIAKISDIVTFIQNIIKILAPAAALAFLVMLLFGGFKFVTSGGDPKQVAGARSTMTYAIIGIILVVLSWLALVLIGNLTGVDLTTVRLPF